MEKSFQIENMSVKIYGQTKEMGAEAADYVTRKLNGAIEKKGRANLILATGASQFSFLEALQTKEIDWEKITVFHLDEYKGISESHPASFRKYLKERILNTVAPKKIYFLNGDAANLQLEIKNYEEALKAHPIDIACIGIGENGHIAFNDPAVADFKDPKLVKVVELDEACRNQQLGEGWFPTFADVPKEAVTLTITAIMNCKAISCVVPDERKAQAVYNSLYGDISTSCPASILRTHPETVLFLDKASASLIK
ncbi:glucosamine-6-phosphate deaminase [Arenibacter palladensis]|uniref:glucosamine-6-phosphate deaminase n=1 Tax=Arenibacter palladensis TaxID=237373 RepID=UPI002FD18671